jgi:hypothetical protein
MKQVCIFLVLILVLMTGVFGATTINDFNVDPNSAKNLSEIEATLTYTEEDDFNAICLSINDNNDSTICMEMDAPSSPYFFDLNSEIINGISSNTTEGNYTIYAVIKLDDGNFSDTNSAELTIDNSAPVLSASYPVEDGAYNSTTIDFDFNITDSYMAIDTEEAVFKVNNEERDATPTPITDGNRFTFQVTGLGEGDNNISYDVNDVLGNNLSGVIYFIIDTNAPTGLSATNPYENTWTNKDKPTFTVLANDNSGSGMDKVAFSCGQSAITSGKWFIEDYAETITNFDITATTYDCNTDDGTKTIYVAFMDRAGNWTTTTTTTVKYDGTAPNKPTNLSATANDGEVYLSWTAPAVDNLSGNAGYKIYVDGTHNKTVTDGTSTTVNGLTNETEYEFEVTTYDNAGNESIKSDEATATPVAGDDTTPSASISVKKGNVLIDYAKSGDTLTIRGTYSEEITNGRIKYRYYQTEGGVGNSTQTLEGPTSNVSLLEETIVIDTGYEKICFWTDEQNITSTEKCVIIDNVLPTIKWDNVLEVFTGNVVVRVSASDNKLVNGVIFTLGTEEFYANKKDGNIYEATIDTTDFNNENIILKAKVTDKAGNIKELSKSVEIINILTPKQDAEAEINSAKNAKAIVNDLIKYFATQGIDFPAELKIQKESADALLEEAEELLLLDVETSKARAKQAKEKYQSINLTAKFEEVPGKIMTYQMPNELTEAFDKIGLNEEQREQAIQLISESNVERKIILVKVGEGENAEYYIKIEITFTNTSEFDKIKIIEKIPTELTNSASKVFSDFNFDILQENPLLEFNLDVAKGASKTITYSVGGAMTESQANEILDSNIIAKFSSPPIILTSETDTSNLKNEINFGMIISYFLVAIVLIIVVSAIIFVSLKQEGNDFGSNNDSIIDKIKNQFKTKSDNQTTKKWAYKEK